MDVRDGFIVGIHNYCDRWCERCLLASRCRLFVEDRQQTLDLPRLIETEGEEQRLNRLGRGGPGGGPLMSDGREDLPCDGFDPNGPGEPSELVPGLAASESRLRERVRVLGFQLWGWAAPDRFGENAAVQDAAAVIRHFGIFIASKVSRALMGRANGGHLAPGSDATGSAKAALLAFDQLGDAWLRLAEEGAIGLLDAEPVISELQRLTLELESLFPYARGFVRPGLDQPDEVALLNLRERG